MHCDFLVVGAGMAGGVAALQAADQGLDVSLIYDQEAASAWAQGGIVCPRPQNKDQLKNDILKAGCGINHREAVDLVVEAGEPAIEKWLIDRLEVPFDRHKNGQLEYVLEAAHSDKCILHHKDTTGLAIHARLWKKLQAHPKIKIQQAQLVDLLLNYRHSEDSKARYQKPKVFGAYVFDEEEKKVEAIHAKTVLLATGGFSRLYNHSTGPKGAIGAGMAAASRAGARLMNLEYMQFHPTALYVQGERRYLLTEALRGAGAKLLNWDKKTFVDELAPRDMVARAIYSEMIKSRSPHLWLDISKVKDFKNNFPAINKLVKEKSMDNLSLLPIVPAAHYSIGGVWSDLNTCSSLDSLLVAGEVSCTGLHGANRLASTSLLEALVFGERAADEALRQSKLKQPEHKARAWSSKHGVPDPALVAQDWQYLKLNMWNYVGVVRSEKRMRRAESALLLLRNEIERFYAESELNETLIRLRHGVQLAVSILYAALKNKKSIGAHYLIDE